MPKKRWGSRAQLQAQQKATLASARQRRLMATLTGGRSERPMPKRRAPQGKRQRNGTTLRHGLGPAGDNAPVRSSRRSVYVPTPARKPDTPKLRDPVPDMPPWKRVHRTDTIRTAADVKYVNNQIRRQNIHLYFGARALKLFDKLNNN